VQVEDVSEGPSLDLALPDLCAARPSSRGLQIERDARSSIRHIRLAAGARLSQAVGRGEASVLLCSSGRVHLNAGAAEILRLCDGSRSRADIIKRVRRTRSNTRASDIGDFLDAARARGWIVEV